ncbi:MAG: phosphate-starvation-inducible E-like protein [Porticoccaceae bacterium]|nr:phosphate-starvation-inducible E-like protein [Porticoccaceae bacterium]
MDNKFLKIIQGLSWTTELSEKLLLGVIGIATCIASAQYLYQMLLNQQVLLADLFMLFIFVEIIGMVGAFYTTSRIPVTLPIIIAITALCRLIVMQSKEMDALMMLYEAGAIFVLSISAYIMSMKEKISLKKQKEVLESKS